MPQYKVLKDFHWGKTYFTKDKTITIEDQPDGSSIVLQEYSSETLTVSTKAVAGMVLLEKIKKV